MYVCICYAVSEHTVRESIEAGAHTSDMVTHLCRAGGDCGSCRQQIDELIEEHLEAREADAARPVRLPVVRPTCAA